MPKAIKDLEEITERIAKNDSIIAERFGNELIDQALSPAPPGLPDGDASCQNLVMQPSAKLSITLIELSIGSGLKPGSFIFYDFGTHLAASPSSKHHHT